MLWKKRNMFLKIGFLTILLCIVSGCGNAPKTQEVKNETEIQTSMQNDAKKLIKICSDIYDKVTKENQLHDLEVVVKQLGKKGYTAIDSKNQIDMTNTQQVFAFCKSVDDKKEATLKIVEVTDFGSFVLYHLQTKNGNVAVYKSGYAYENGNIQNTFEINYMAKNWQYTEDGYILFSGNTHVEALYLLTLQDMQEDIAFRVEPLDEKCRAYNRRYILPIGYAQNNMFLVDWNEHDFGALDFYDLYDILYYNIHGTYVPYVPDENLNVGAVYQIPKHAFESVIMQYFAIDSQTLQYKTTYDTTSESYTYKPRGFYEVEYPAYPYPEVVAYQEHDDGTITLTINVVFPHGGTSKMYVHDVVVRPLENGGVQYVSNHIIDTENHQNATWYTPRLTDAQWEETYKNQP